MFFSSGGTGGTLVKVPPVYFLGNPASDPTDMAEPPNGFRLCNPKAPPDHLQKYFCLFFKFQQILDTKITLISMKHSSKSSTIKTKPSLHLNKPKAISRQNSNSNFVYLRNPSKGSLNQTLKPSHDYFALSAQVNFTLHLLHWICFP